MVDKYDPVNNPKHYKILGGESIELIARSCSMEMWKGACLFNVMKYRLRAGKKDCTEQELAKADNYNDTLYEKYLPYCYDYVVPKGRTTVTPNTELRYGLTNNTITASSLFDLATPGTI